MAFDQPIIIPATATDGYIYVWVSNESENTKVWFDDLRVTHTQTIVTQATDHGVWGDVLRELKAAEFTYRFGYQGQFAEEDEETGWNHFELREYDPIIGRWLVPDPYRQYWSPYLAMGNNPINKVDPDGGCDDCPPFLPNGSQELWNEHLRWSEMFAGRPGGWSSFMQDFSYLFGNLFSFKPGIGIVFYGSGTGNMFKGGNWSDRDDIYVLDSETTINFLNFLSSVAGERNKAEIDNIIRNVNNPYSVSKYGENIKTAIERIGSTLDPQTKEKVAEKFYELVGQSHHNLDRKILQQLNDSTTVITGHPENSSWSLRKATSKNTGETRVKTLKVPVHSAPLN